MQQAEYSMAEQIFMATERLIAKDGLPNLSMHKIAKEAHISAGTIYIYFKGKDELLEKLVEHVFSCLNQEIGKNVQATTSLFQQYRQMWKNIYAFFLDNPTRVGNMYQYQSLPTFYTLCQQYHETGYWALFCQRAKQADILIDLPMEVLFSLSLESAMKLALKRQHFQRDFSNEILETVIERTWRSIQQ